MGVGGTACSPNCCYSPPNLYIRLVFLNTLPIFKIIIISFTRRSFGSILSFVNTATHFNKDVAGPALPRRSSRSSLTSPCPQDARHLALLCFLHRNEWTNEWTNATVSPLLLYLLQVNPLGKQRRRGRQLTVPPPAPPALALPAAPESEGGLGILTNVALGSRSGQADTDLTVRPEPATG